MKLSWANCLLTIYHIGVLANSVFYPSWVAMQPADNEFQLSISLQKSILISNIKSESSSITGAISVSLRFAFYLYKFLVKTAVVCGHCESVIDVIIVQTTEQSRSNGRTLCTPQNIMPPAAEA